MNNMLFLYVLRGWGGGGGDGYGTLFVCIFELKSIVLQRKYVATTRGYHNNNMYHLFNLCPFWKASKQIGDLETV